MRDVLKEHISNYVKGFGWSELKICWYVQIKKHAVEYLLEDLLHFMCNNALNNKPKTKPHIVMPIGKTLPSLGVRTADVRAKEKDDVEELRVT